MAVGKQFWQLLGLVAIVPGAVFALIIYLIELPAFFVDSRERWMLRPARTLSGILYLFANLSFNITWFALAPVTVFAAWISNLLMPYIFSTVLAAALVLALAISPILVTGWLIYSGLSKGWSAIQYTIHHRPELLQKWIDRGHLLMDYPATPVENFRDRVVVRFIKDVFR